MALSLFDKKRGLPKEIDLIERSSESKEQWDNLINYVEKHYGKSIEKWIILSIFIFLFVFMTLFNSTFINSIDPNSNTQARTELRGEIYYTKRINGVNMLFKSDANLEHEILLYSHLGKGKNHYGNFNDNIIDFFYDEVTEYIHFVAMNEGEWYEYQLDSKQNRIDLKRKTVFQKETASFLTKTSYLSKQFNQQLVIERNGSLYITENGTEKCVLKFNGIYDQKFTGYRPTGFSPDGKYLIYYSMEHLTPIGTIVDIFFDIEVGQNYIMELSSGKSTKYINASPIQWVYK